MFVIVKAKAGAEGAGKVAAVWGPFRDKYYARTELTARVIDFYTRRQKQNERLHLPPEYRVARPISSDGDQVYVHLYKAYEDSERFPPVLEHWVYRVMPVDESIAPGDVDIPEYLLDEYGVAHE